MKTLAAAVLVAAVCAGCSVLGKAQATPSPSPTAPTLAQATGPLDAEVPMPAGFPSDVPIYPSSRLTAGASFTSNGLESWGMEWESLDSIAKVHAFYASKLAQGDWTVTFTANSATAFSATFARKSNSAVKGVLGADGGSGVTKISLYLSMPTS